MFGVAMPQMVDVGGGAAFMSSSRSRAPYRYLLGGEGMNTPELAAVLVGLPAVVVHSCAARMDHPTACTPVLAAMVVHLPAVVVHRCAPGMDYPTACNPACTPACAPRRIAGDLRRAALVVMVVIVVVVLLVGIAAAAIASEL